MAKKRNRAAQDSTLINTRALKKRVLALEVIVGQLANGLALVYRVLKLTRPTRGSGRK